MQEAEAIEAQNWQRTVSRDVSSKALGELTAKGMISFAVGGFTPVLHVERLDVPCATMKGAAEMGAVEVAAPGNLAVAGPL